jgi:hypothetical protein
MKNLIKINLLVVTGIILCNIAQGQQRASDKSFNSVLNEVKQKQAMRNKMLQQIKQTTAVNTSQNNTTDAKPSNAGTNGTTTGQSTTGEQGANPHASNNQSATKPLKSPLRSKQ